mmetsp:Transcript_57100/g.114581  ORF Transcript_57100/g.114581 Transcript_57100/m.114581 type:complete len:297 (-) Transcript_57100:189-1079(-)
MDTAAAYADFISIYTFFSRLLSIDLCSSHTLTHNTWALFQGGTMRFEPEKSDGANAGLHIIHDLVLPIKKKHGDKVSFGDLWALAGACAVELAGGPEIPLELGRVDVLPAEAAVTAIRHRLTASPSSSTSTSSSDGASGQCPIKAAAAVVPPNGLLPDASQGAAHLREVFGRMGFNDREIVALSGGHTLGRCHSVRSGYDGPWTDHILKFNNAYYKNLMGCEWEERRWDGPRQYANVGDGRLMMLPTDIALKTDPLFAPIAQVVGVVERDPQLTSWSCILDLEPAKHTRTRITHKQ